MRYMGTRRWPGTGEVEIFFSVRAVTRAKTLSWKMCRSSLKRSLWRSAGLGEVCGRQAGIAPTSFSQLSVPPTLLPRLQDACCSMLQHNDLYEVFTGVRAVAANHQWSAQLLGASHRPQDGLYNAGQA